MAEPIITHREDDGFTTSKKWREKRLHILRRDSYMDQVRLRDGVRIEADTVHHILPRESFPQYAFCDWNLISVNKATHDRILHKPITRDLTKRGELLMKETAYANGVKLKMLIMVIGEPGSGKSTYIKKHLGGGLAYELDAIACAFRLTVPHKETPHVGARKMAAKLRKGWLELAPQYASTLFVNRSCPDIEELAETMPDKLVVCQKKHADRPYRYDPEEYRERIEGAIEWAKQNGIEIEYAG